MINTARHRAAREAYKAAHNSLTQNVYSLTLDSAGKAPFTSQTDLLPESIPVCNDIQHATVTAAVGLPFEILGSVSDLKVVRSSSQLAYAAVGDQAVYTSYPAGTLANGSTLFVRACKVPSLGSWPTQIEDRLIDALQEVASERMKLEPAEQVGGGVR